MNEVEFNEPSLSKEIVSLAFLSINFCNSSDLFPSPLLQIQVAGEMIIEFFRANTESAERLANIVSPEQQFVFSFITTLSLLSLFSSLGSLESVAFLTMQNRPEFGVKLFKLLIDFLGKQYIIPTLQKYIDLLPDHARLISNSWAF